ncbi:MAG: DUF3127 domain-containing protein [Bacteroidaceae bacterium]|nr:DUF3127 domain-containing protein [Bacteroidaceae bacterium]
MELTGKIIAALDKRSGTSARTGNTWASQEFVIEVPGANEQYPRRCVFTVFGEDRLANMNIQVGEQLTVSFDIDAHEYNGRWFNDIRAWKVDRTPVGAPVAQPAPQQVASFAQPQAQNADPFAAPTTSTVQASLSSDIAAGDGSSSDDLPF